MKEFNNITIVGLGSQAKAWALNLRDSGKNITLALRKNSPSIQMAKELGLNYFELGTNTFEDQMILLLIPDQNHFDFLKDFHHQITPKTYLTYAHGASIVQYNIISKFPQFNHLLLAPKAIASEVRFQYETKGKLGACYALEGCENKENALSVVQSLATALGITGGPYVTSFKDEAYADLFSEQSLLCGLLPYAALQSFNLLRTKGISEEVAYMECWLEVKLIADAMVKLGPEAFFQLISPYALKGAVDAEQVLFDKAYQEKLQLLWQKIDSKEFLESIEYSDMQAIREKTLNFWKQTELNHVHQRISGDLI